MTVKWNADKPHRCPNCHRVVDWGKPPRKWRRYTCPYCGCKFAWWGRGEPA